MKTFGVKKKNMDSVFQNFCTHFIVFFPLEISPRFIRGFYHYVQFDPHTLGLQV